MLGRSSINARVLLLASGTCLSLAPSSHAIGLNWTNALGGSAATAGNWSPAQIPTAADDLTFNLAATYSVTWPIATVPTSRSQTYRAGTVAATFNGHTLTSQLTVGLLSGNNATLAIGGDLFVNNFVTIGRDGGAAGVLNFANGASGLTVSGAGFDLIVGQAGRGTLNILNGSDADVSSTGDDILIGNLATGEGIVHLQGSGPNQGSLSTNNTIGGDIFIGVAGSGTVDVATNGNLSSGQDLFMAPNPGSTGTLVAGDGSGSTLARVTARRDLHIGHNSGANSAGTATFTANAGASVNAASSGPGTTFVGDPNGGSGTLNLRGGLFATHTLVVDPVGGSLDHTGGELRIKTGGSYTANGMSVLDGPAGADEPLLHFQGSTGGLVGGFLAGVSRTGRILIDQGAVVTGTLAATSTGFQLGVQAGSSGFLTVSGTGSRLTLNVAATSLLVGFRGTGTLSVTDGAALDTTFLDTLVASTNGSSGRISVESGGQMTLRDALVIGGTVAGTGGTGVLRLSGSGHVNCGRLIVWPGSAALVDDGVVTAQGVATLRGSVSISNAGEIAARTIDIFGSILGAGNLFGSVTVRPGGFVSAAGGTLFIGSPSNAPDGFTNLGTLQVRDQQVVIQDGDASPAGDITIEGGHLLAPGGLTFGATDSLIGFGGITAPVSLNTSTIVTAQSAAGLTFNGPVSGTGVQITGALATFAAGGGFTGSGIVATKVASEEEAAITATGNLSLGADLIGGLVLNGPLHVGAATVSLLSDTPAELGIRTTLTGGTLIGPDTSPRTISSPGLPPVIPPSSRTVQDVVPILLRAFDELEGRGTVSGKLRTLPSSRVIATGPLFLLGSGSPLGILRGTILDNGESFAEWNGNLEAGPHTVTFTGFHRMGGTTTLSGGTVRTGGLVIQGTVTGDGSLIGTPASGGVENGGVITPGGAAAGEVRIEGGFTNSFIQIGGTTAGLLQLDLSGDQGFVHDVIRVTSGDAQLSGTLNVGVLDAPPDPAVEYPVIIVENGSVVGEFQVVNLPPGMTVVYRESEVVITGATCFADFNADGGIDGGDVDAFFDSWENGDARADVNQDGGIDGADVVTFFEAWEAGGCE